MTIRPLRLLAIFFAVLCVSAVASAFPAAAQDHGAPAKNDKPVSIRLEPLTVGIQRNGVVEKHVGFTIVLEVANAAAQAKVQSVMAKVNDAFVVDINALASLPQAADTGIDPEALKRRLNISAERVLGPHVVTNIVFLRSFTRKVS